MGTAYHGWQRQPNALTVQEVLEGVMGKLLRIPLIIVGAGRTDAGVHAHTMFGHCDLETIDNIENFIYRTNAFLPDDIAVHKILPVAQDAHARFDATSRSYTYTVCMEKSPFLKDTAYYVRAPLDVAAMNDACQILLGKQDFECFSKSKTDVRTYMCDVREASWNLENNTLVFRITADRFLRNMVRAIVGTLLNVGLGKYTEDHVKAILKSKDRSRAGVSVPAKGLSLTSIVYPNAIFL